LAGRTCYKSEEKIKDDSYIAFIKMLINKGHFAMIEHSNVVLELNADSYFHLNGLKARLDLDDLETYDTRFLNVTTEAGRCLVSANLRVFRDLYKFYKESQTINDIWGTLFQNGYGIILTGLIEENEEFKTNDSVKLITDYSDFSAIEKLYHTIQSVKFVCDRGVSHEIVRHRVAAFAQESTRFCNYGKDEHINFIIPSWLPDVKEEELNERTRFIHHHDSPEGIWMHCMADAEHHYNQLVGPKDNPIWIAGRARSILPNSLKTEIIVTMNLRGWKHFFDMRLPVTAHEQMRELTIPLYENNFKIIYENIRKV
jgi:thymidylate synthase (FAD)